VNDVISTGRLASYEKLPVLLLALGVVYVWVIPLTKVPVPAPVTVNVNVAVITFAAIVTVAPVADPVTVALVPLDKRPVMPLGFVKVRVPVSLLLVLGQVKVMV
jgi:hypothetical protein